MKRNTKLKVVFVTGLLILVNLFISRSAYAILFHFFVLAVLLFFLYRKFFFFSVTSLLVLSASFIALLVNVESEVRFINLFIAVFDNPDFLLGQGAIQRLFNIPITLNNIFYFDWYGAGIKDIAAISSIPTPLGILEYPVRNRSYGGYIEYLLKFGVLSLPVMAIIFYWLNKIRKIVIRIGGKSYYLGYFFSFTLFILTFQDGSPANPLPIFILLYIYLKSNHLRNKTNYVQSY